MESLLGTTSIFSGIDIDNPIKKATQSVADAISGFGSTLVNPMKTVGESTTSGVALVDENSSVVSQNLNNYKSDTITGIVDKGRDFAGGILNNPDLGRIFDFQDGFRVNADELVRIASQGLGFSVGGIGDIKQSLGDSFLNELNSMTGGLSSGLYFDDGMKLKVGDGWQRQAGEELLGFISRMDSPFGKVLNLAGVNSILNVMVRQAAENSMYQSYRAFEGEYLFRSDYIDALINSLEYCIGRGDIESMNEIFSIIEKEGLQVVRAKYPDLIERTLSSFYFSSDVMEEDYPRLSEMLDKLLVMVGGPNWYTFDTEFGPATNYVVVSNITEPAKLLLGEYPKYHPLLLSAGRFQEGSALDEFLRQIPNAVKFEN